MGIVVGYTQDWFGHSTNKVEVVGETLKEQYICRKCPEIMTNYHGGKYVAQPLASLFLRSRTEVFGIHEEEMEVSNGRELV